MELQALEIEVGELSEESMASPSEHLKRCLVSTRSILEDNSMPTPLAMVFATEEGAQYLFYADLHDLMERNAEEFKGRNSTMFRNMGALVVTAARMNGKHVDAIALVIPGGDDEGPGVKVFWETAAGVAQVHTLRCFDVEDRLVYRDTEVETASLGMLGEDVIGVDLADEGLPV